MLLLYDEISAFSLSLSLSILLSLFSNSFCFFLTFPTSLFVLVLVLCLITFFYPAVKFRCVLVPSLEFSALSCSLSRDISFSPFVGFPSKALLLPAPP